MINEKKCICIVIKNNNQWHSNNIIKRSICLYMLYISLYLIFYNIEYIGFTFSFRPDRIIGFSTLSYVPSRQE